MIDFDDIVDQPWRLQTDEVKSLCGLAFKSGPELCSTVDLQWKVKALLASL
jgi:hypothetical protein